MQNKILVLDIETTGFLAKGGKIVEVGIVELDTLTGDKRIVFDSVCHERPITQDEVENSWIVQNSNLTVNDIRHSTQFRALESEIQNTLNCYPLGCTAFNSKFDFDFLESRGIKFPKKLPCPMLLSTNICKLPNPNSRTSYKWPKVEEAYKFFYPESEYVEKHRGADDAWHEADIVFALIQRGLFKA